MDMTSGQFIQFSIRLGCDDSVSRPKRSSSQQKVPQWSQESTSLYSAKSDYSNQPQLSRREEGILVQFSNDGGINWELLKEIHYTEYSRPRFISINLEDFPNSQTNATRFRFWQPAHPPQYGSKSWAIDNVYIGGSPIVPNVLYEDFNGHQPLDDAWIDWPGADIGKLCGRYVIISSTTIII